MKGFRLQARYKTRRILHSLLWHYYSRRELPISRADRDQAQDVAVQLLANQAFSFTKLRALERGCALQVREESLRLSAGAPTWPPEKLARMRRKHLRLKAKVKNAHRKYRRLWDMLNGVVPDFPHWSKNPRTFLIQVRDKRQKGVFPPEADDWPDPFPAL